jgi:DNA polymerase-1
MKPPLDFHTRTAEMLGLASRKEAKIIDFGIIFGQGARALAREINDSWKEQGQPGRVNETQAEEYIQAFFATYKGILPYFKQEYDKLTGREISERVLKNPLTGRIRRFPKRESNKLMREMKATLLQQVESHLLKVALVRLNTEIKGKGLDARIVACIHDSIWVEAAAEEDAEVRRIMTEVMTGAAKLDEPWEVDIKRSALPQLR